MACRDLSESSSLPGLQETAMEADPFRQFRAWFDQAEAASLLLPEAMTLATATPEGKPSARMVLLRGFDERGFVFFTNFESRKGHELAANPWAALVFYWGELERQVRVEGPVQKVADEEADAYFQNRDRGSQLGAWASPQSQVIAGRQVLERRLQEWLEEYDQRPVPRPPFWGGYRVIPFLVEFWQGRPNRLHDRLCYHKQENGWRIERLSP